MVEREIQSGFKAALLSCLKLEFTYISQVAQGLQQRRNFLGEFVDPGTSLAQVDGVSSVGNVIDVMHDIGLDLYQLMRNPQMQTTYTASFLSLLLKNAETFMNVVFEAVAAECSYRYGSALNVVRTAFPGQIKSLLQVIARLGAVRILYYGVKTRADFKNPLALCNGVNEGNQGFDGDNLWTPLGDTEFKYQDFTFTAEAFFTRLGRVRPEGPTFHFYIDRNPTEDPQLVLYANEQQEDCPRDEMTPKLGYLQLPADCALSTGFSAHNPDGNNASLSYKSFKKSPAKYVTYVLIEKFLEYCKTSDSSAEGSQGRPPNFLDWLDKYFEDMYPIGVETIFRGTIDRDDLQQKGLSFEMGSFSGIDFSHCEFKNIKFTNLSHCKLAFCKMTNCEFNGKYALDKAYLDGSSISGCTFKDLSGHLSLEHADVKNSSFVNCTFLVFNCRGCTWDEISTAQMEGCVGPGGEEPLVMGVREELAKAQRVHEIEQQYRTRMEAVKGILIAKLDANQENVEATKEEVKSEVELIHKNLSEATSSVHQEVFRAFNPTSLQSYITTTQLKKEVVLDVYNMLFFSRPFNKLSEILSSGQVPVWKRLNRKYHIHTNGRDGQEGRDGRDGRDGSTGGTSGLNGMDGSPGGAGTHAQPNVVSILSFPDQNFFMVTPETLEPLMLPLYDSDVGLRLEALGGKGGNGGRGGKGGNGGNGRHGQNASMEAPGTNGENGGVGGHGGSGGNGGIAGNSENIKIYVKDVDMDLLAVITGTDVSSSKGGNGGEPGKAGTGGTGGRGGRSYEWSETYKDGDSTRTVYKSNPGGRDGMNGSSGSPGERGIDGENGSQGAVFFHIIEITDRSVPPLYRTVYSLMLNKYDPFASNTGLFEPGQTIKIFGFDLQNVGGMPTPRNRFEIYVCGNDVIQEGKSSRLLLTDPIIHTVNNGRKLLPKEAEIEFVTHRFTNPLINTVHRKHTPVLILAELPRVKKIYDFSQDRRTIQICYPVELSEVRSRFVFSPGSEIPFSLKIKNYSTIAIGQRAPHPRLLRLDMSIESNIHLSKKPFSTVGVAQQNRFYNSAFDHVIVGEIGYIASDAELVVSGSIGFERPFDSIRDYEFLPLTLTLRIGDFESPLQIESTRVAQKEVQYVQIAREFTGAKKNDLLLIVNCLTKKIEIDHWRLVAGLLGLTLNVWNVSIDNGFSLKHPLLNPITNLEDGIVVILNTMYKSDFPVESYGDLQSTISSIPTGEIFEAARTHGIRVFIVNETKETGLLPTLTRPVLFYPKPAEGATDGVEAKKPDGLYEGQHHFGRREEFYGYLKKMFTPITPPPLVEKVPPVYKYVAKNKALLFSTPTEKMMVDGVSKFNSKLVSLCPTFDHYFKYNFNVEKLPAGCIPKYKLGEIEVRRGLDKNHAMIGLMNCTSLNRDPRNVPYRTEGPQLNHEVTVWCIAKLLPLEKKLLLLNQSSPDERLRGIIPEVILADLADEINVFSEINASKAMLDTYATAFKVFSDFDFMPLITSHGELGKKVLFDIILKLRIYKRSLSKLCMETPLRLMIKGYLKKAVALYFPDVPYSTLKARCLKFLTDSSRGRPDIRAFVTQYRDPRNLSASNVEFNNWVAKTAGGHMIDDKVVAFSRSAYSTKFLQQKEFHDKMYYYCSRPGSIQDSNTAARYGTLPDEELERQNVIYSSYGQKCRYRQAPPALYKNKAGSLVREARQEAENITFY